MTGIDDIIDLLTERGGRQYGGEPVSEFEHALQCATAAEEAGAPSALIVASLLHDIGHLVHDLGPLPAERGVDDRHERQGEAWLARWFGPEVTAPVRLHVDAKRYLCTAEPGYFSALSRASVRSLELQGGPFTAEAARAFIAQPRAEDAVRLRRWDETAKIRGKETPPLEHFRPHLQTCLRIAAE